MNLRQINIQYEPEQDRLLMRISSGANEEVALWLTRRCVKLLWPALVNLAGSDPDLLTQSQEAKSALLGIRHEEALARADFSRPYEAPAEHPLGTEPILVAKVQARRAEEGAFVLTLLPNKGQGVNLALDEKLLHSVCGLLQKVASNAEWEMKLEWPQASASASAVQGRLN